MHTVNRPKLPSGLVNIGEAANLSGVLPRMIRYYESLGLLPPANRTSGGYRQYGKTDIQILRFIRLARDLGFSMTETSEMLELWRNQCRTRKEVLCTASRYLQCVEERLAELESMQKSLHQLLGEIPEVRD